ncbi:unnamed protein product [Closterium sp. NIES-65]|nr:unnamed protein product [Closterium sp. NIES-65]
MWYAPFRLRTPFVVLQYRVAPPVACRGDLKGPRAAPQGAATGNGKRGGGGARAPGAPRQVTEHGWGGVEAGPKGAATGPQVAATGPLEAAMGPIGAASGPLGAATGPLVAATGPIGAATGPRRGREEPGRAATGR